MASPSSPVLQKLDRLDTSSSDFDDQLCGFLSGREYVQCVPNLRNDDLVWLVDYLDKAFIFLTPSGPASRKCLRELRSICATTSILPTSYTVLPQLLDTSPDPFARGGSSNLYHGTLDGSRVCVKCLRMYRDSDEQITRMFYRGAVTWKSLAHPNIVPFVGVVTVPPQLISIWMPGGTLPKYIKKHPNADQVGLLSDVVKGLCHLHSFNVVHGGIRGSNILVDDSNRARIAGFDQAMVINDGDPPEDDSRVGFAFRWDAPEVLAGGVRSKKSDTFSFAMVMIEVFTGAFPLSGQSVPAVMVFILQGRRPTRPTHPALTDNLWGLIQRCWDHDPDLRPEASEVLQALSAPAEPRPWKRLISDITLSKHERVSLITCIFSDSNEVESVRLLSGDDAQAFIDVIDEALEHLPRQVYWRCLRYSYRICGRQSLLPNSVAIPTCYDPMETPQSHGGFADVWKGKHMGRDVAAKVLRTSMSSDLDRIRRRFCKEVMTWNTLRHTNVLALVGVTMTESRFVMVSEWMENGNINQFVEKNTDANRLDLLVDVTRGLMYMHSRGIVHGDLKGPNILIKNDGHACIADFSLLTIISDQQTFLSTTVDGGTIPWMSPELLDPTSFGVEKCRLTKESDRYSLGMVIYEVLSGMVPFAPIKVPVLKILRGERPKRPQSEQGALFTDSIWEMLELCWKPLPNDRPSLNAVLRCLLRCLRGDTRSWTLVGTDTDAPADSDEGDQSDVTIASGSDLSIMCRATVPKSGPVPPVSQGVPQDDGQPIDPPQPSDREEGRNFRRLMGDFRDFFGTAKRKSPVNRGKPDTP